MTTLQNFLKKYSISKEDKGKIKPTHTRIPDKQLGISGGSYHIPPEKENIFNTLYYNEIIANGGVEYLTEKQKENGKIYIDLDFRYSYNIDVRQHSKEMIVELLHLYCETLKEMVQIYSDEDVITIYVMERDRVNRLQDQTKTKDGIHILFDVKQVRFTHTELRRRVIEKLEKNKELLNLPLQNNFNEVFDEGISTGATNIQLFGSRKPGHEPYKLKYIFHFRFDEETNKFNMTETYDTTMTKDMFLKLCARNDEDATLLWLQSQFIAQLEKHKQEKQQNDRQQQLQQQNMNTFPADSEVIKKYKELLKLVRVDDPKNRKLWLTVCKCIISNGLSNNDWMQFCLDNGLNIDTEKENLFHSLQPNQHYDIAYIETLAKSSNPNQYKEWVNKWNVNVITQICESISQCEVSEPVETIPQSEVNEPVISTIPQSVASIEKITERQVSEPKLIAEIISKTLKQTLKLCNDEWYMLTSNNLWEKQKNPTFYVLDELYKYLDKTKDSLNAMHANAVDDFQKQQTTKRLQEWLNKYIQISKQSYLTVLINILRPLLMDNEFSKKLDNNKGFLAFKNGIVDLRTKEFRKGILWNDFITKTILYDYVPSDFTYLKSILKPIMNNDEEHLEYWLSILGYSFIGNAELEKSIYFMIDKTDCGRGDNGKTFFFDILTCLMPNYVYSSSAALLENNNGTVHKQIAMTKGKRLVWMDEMPREKYLNVDLAKVLADGKMKENPVMYGTCELINITYKLFALSNHMPKIDCKENAVYNRYKQVSFNSHFDRTGTRMVENPDKLEFIADAHLPNKIKENHYNEVFNMIIHYANKYYTDGIPPIPQQFVRDTNETKKNNDSFAEWFHDNCKVDASKKEAEQAIIYKSNFKKDEVRQGMLRLGYKYDKDLRGIGKDFNDKYYKGGYVGIVLKEDDDDSDSGEE